MAALHPMPDPARMRVSRCINGMEPHGFMVGLG